ncbi:MAG TPA: sulfatase-like hydrolase/transferase [Gemmatimonadales bacterium]|nr:sulfatase-like hydrolase/transferase [Gemmatimonadales bacterium]
MISRVARAYPWLIALIPTVNYAANNPDQYGMGNLAFLVAVTTAGCAALYALASLAVRGRGAPALPAFITLLGVGWVFGYRRVAGILTGDAAHPPHLLLVPAALVLCVALVWWVRRRDRLLDGLGRFLTLMTALLVGYAALRIGRDWVQGEAMVAESRLARELAEPIDGPANPPQPRRDVYLIVVDEYANSDVLRERFGYDNRPFEDSLRALGFYIPPVVRSNYLHTLLSLPSMLNAAHLDGLELELGAYARHPRLPNYLLGQARVARYLKDRGYEYVFFPSDWFHSTSDSPRADRVFHAFQGFDFMRAMSEGELERTVRGITVLSYFDRTHHYEAEHVRRTLEGVAALAGTGTRPRFVFAHVLKPHEPYVFKRDCEVQPRQPEDDYAGLYLEQLQCVNRLVLATVRRIRAESRVPPVILLQGDHGSKALEAYAYHRPEDVPPEAARERFGAFGAYYLPGGGAEAFGDTVTVVNVLGNILRHYFGAHLPRSGDEQYISPARFPYNFRKVDGRWLTGHSRTPAKAVAGR